MLEVTVTFLCDGDDPVAAKKYIDNEVRKCVKLKNYIIRYDLGERKPLAFRQGMNFPDCNV